MRYLVTGATGFVGSALCARLQDAGAELIAWSRSGGILADGSPSRAVELCAPFSLPAGVDSICHLASVAHQRAPEAAYQRINVEGSLRLARAALEAGVRRFLFVSSVKAMGPAVDERPRTEDCIRPARDPYGASKWQAEQGLRELCRGTGMDLVIVRPPLVYGPAPRGNLHLLDRGARLGIPPPPQGGARSMVGLEDLTGLLAELMWRAPPGQHTWIVSDGERYTARNIFDLLCRAHGRSPGRSWVPARGWHLACSVLDRLQGWPAGSAREKLFGTELYDSTALRRDIGWRPTQTLADVAPLIAAR